MPKPAMVLHYATHPHELRAMLQWKLWHEPLHTRNIADESESLTRCFHYLKLTSRSFCTVILELHPELLVPICIFYLVLRGLDTIEDDMTIPIQKKVELLRNFHSILNQEGWTFDGNGPNEKDRDLLVEFHCVVTEFGKLKPAYQTTIKDIAKAMGDGMADFCIKGENKDFRVESVKEYELYCHYVAGLVGEGCTRLFVEAKLASPVLLECADLHQSMGQFLQQTNIIRDIREDKDDQRFFWPREIWSKHVDKFELLFEPSHREQALACQTEMILTALRRADDCLYYLAGIRDQSVFNFCAIPQTMAIATLDLCFRNPAVFERNVKITRGHACSLMLQSTQNLRTVCDVFKRFARNIHKRNNPMDPNFLEISIACGKIEAFIESIFPTTTTPRTLVSSKDQDEKRAEDAEAKQDFVYITLAILGTFALIALCMLGIAYFFGARFDLAFEQLSRGGLQPPGSHHEAQKMINGYKARKQEL